LVERLAPALGEIEAAIDVVNAFRDPQAGTLKLNILASIARLILPPIVALIRGTEATVTQNRCIFPTPITIL
jgi:DNA-binding transcriptional LysR family regulator